MALNHSAHQRTTTSWQSRGSQCHFWPSDFFKPLRYACLLLRHTTSTKGIAPIATSDDFVDAVRHSTQPPPHLHRRLLPGPHSFFQTHTWNGSGQKEHEDFSTGQKPKFPPLNGMERNRKEGPRATRMARQYSTKCGFSTRTHANHAHQLLPARNSGQTDEQSHNDGLKQSVEDGA